MGFLRCFLYLMTLGVLGFFTGRILPKEWLDASKFPFKAYKFEKGGKLYDKLNIKKWQNKVPDMSRIFPKLIPPKRIEYKADKTKLETMLHETCVAEIIHTVLPILAIPCFWLWKGRKGRIIYYVYVLLGNLPYIIIQRYNRPRITRLLRNINALKDNVKLNSEHTCENAS